MTGEGALETQGEVLFSTQGGQTHIFLAAPRCSPSTYVDKTELATYLLCELGHVPVPLWALESSLEEVGSNSKPPSSFISLRCCESVPVLLFPSFLWLPGGSHRAQACVDAAL